MGILRKTFGHKDYDLRLHGVWNSDLNDDDTKNNIGTVTMTFIHEGKLIYDKHGPNKIERINLIYWTKGETLFTDQPSHPKEEKTKYYFPDKDTLVLSYDGQLTMFKRESG